MLLYRSTKVRDHHCNLGGIIDGRGYRLGTGTVAYNALFAAGLFLGFVAILVLTIRGPGVVL